MPTNKLKIELPKPDSEPKPDTEKAPGMASLQSLPKEWWQSIRRRLYAGSCYLQTDSGVTVVQTPGQQSVWVVGRDCCVFRSIDLQHVPVSRRDAALKLQLPVLSPFADFGYRVEWQSGSARIWLWNEKKRAELAAQQTSTRAVQQTSTRAVQQTSTRAVQQTSTRAAQQTTIREIVVESAFTRAEEGLTLYQCQRGFMVQQWRDGQLLMDSWWESLPGHAAWQHFLRATEPADYSENSDAASAISINGQTINETITGHTPDQDTARALPVIGHTPRTAGGYDALRARETGIIVAICLVLCCILSFEVVTMGRNALDRYFLGAEVKELNARHQEVIAVRDQVYRLHAENLAIAGLSGISQLETLAKVANSLPPGAGPVFSWEFRDGELKILLRDESPDLRQYVSRLEAVSGFSDIAVQPLDRQRRVEITLRVGRGDSAG